MKLIVLATFAVLILVGCDKGQEIKLLSENNKHMFYLYPEDSSAELYTGMSMIGDYSLSLNKKIYTLVPKKAETGKIELVLDSNTGNWACRGCRVSGLSSQWLQQ
jgi:uncharacterized lipoprotein NlpE involved in copper resistance